MVSRTRTAPLTLGGNFLPNPQLAAAPGLSGPGFAPIAVPEAPFSKHAYWALLAFVFISTSRLPEYVLGRLHLPLVLAILSAGLAFISAGPLRVLATWPGKLLVGYAGWFVLCIPFSEWKGGSFEVLINDFLKSFLLFATVASTVSSARRLRGVMLAISLGAMVAMGIALYFNDQTRGRLGMPGGQLGNPNDLAQYMMLGMCLLPVLSVGDQQFNRIIRGLAYLMMVPFLYTAFATGSRGVLVALMMIAGIVFWNASINRKIVLGLLFGIVGGGMFAISDTARVRLTTVFSESEAARIVNSVEQVAESSMQARLTTLQQSVSLTLRNPIFGVGPGNFESSAAGERVSEGEKALWVETHNAYTEVSSETGIVGLLFFLGGILGCVGGLWKLRRVKAVNNPEIAFLKDVSTFLLLGFGGFLFTVLFSAGAFKSMFWLLLGLCVASVEIARRQALLPKAAMQPSMPAPAQLLPLLRPPAMPAPRAQSLPVPPAEATRVTLSGRIRPVRSSPLAK